MGMGEYNTLHEMHKAKCPECDAYVKTADCGFSSCQYQFFGMKVNSTGHLEYVKCDWKPVTEEDCYQAFRSSDLGAIDWHSLVIQTRSLYGRLNQEDVCCSFLEEFSIDGDGPVCTLRCGHQFHGKCGPAWVGKHRICPVCHLITS